jgi:hypothetical protein
MYIEFKGFTVSRLENGQYIVTHRYDSVKLVVNTIDEAMEYINA